MVKTGVLTTVFLIGAAAAALAHPSTDARDALSAVEGQQPVRAADQDTVRNRQKISMIEGSFERAVQNGADNFARQIKTISPDADGMAMLLGAPIVRGFRLEHYGVFFDVQMPSLQLSMVWPLRYTQESDARRRNGLAPVASVQAAPVTPPASPDAGILDDPAEAWRREVRATLIDAMFENTGGVTVAADEYLTVAARGVLPTDRLADPGDTRTIELSLKGSDLLAFRANSIPLEEARKRVRIREY